MKKILALLTLPALLSVVAFTRVKVNTYTQKAEYQNGNTGVVTAFQTNNVNPKCSRQFAIPIEKFWGGLGARGSIRNNQGIEWNGWALFDTGADQTRLRHPTIKNGLDINTTMNSILSFGDWRAAESSVLLSPGLWAITAPNNIGDTAGSKGLQIATIGTAIMKDFAVRIDDDKMYFSYLSRACTEDQLKSEGYVRMDTSGFYQSEGQYVPVSNKYLAPNIPTVWIDIFGFKVPAQIDTGYQVQSGKNYIHANKPLMDLLKSKLPPLDSSGDESTDYHIINKGFTYLVSKGATTEITSLSNVYIRPKHSGGGGIAEWGIPAAMISAPAFFNSFSSSEFRADKKSVWVKTR